MVSMFLIYSTNLKILEDKVDHVPTTIRIRTPASASTVMRTRRKLPPRDSKGRFRKKTFNFRGLPVELRIEIYRLCVVEDKFELLPTCHDMVGELLSEELGSVAQFASMVVAIPEFTDSYIQRNILRSSDMLFIQDGNPPSIIGTPEAVVGTIMREFNITRLVYDRRGGYGYSHHGSDLEHGYDCPVDCYCKCEETIEIYSIKKDRGLHAAVWAKKRDGFVDGKRPFRLYSRHWEQPVRVLQPLWPLRTYETS